MGYLETLFNISGKIAVITGGGGILAGAMAEGLAQAGVTVLLLDLSLEKAMQRADVLREKGFAAEGMQCNVLDEMSLELLQRRIIENYGRIDILINAAGGNMPAATVPEGKSVFDLAFDGIRKAVDLNLHGTILPTLMLGKGMAEAHHGSIINISSMASFRAISRGIGYSAAKAAVDNFTRWMAMEMAMKFGDGIRVNAIAPGFLLTDQNRSLLTEPDGSLTERGRTVIAATPFRRLGEPDELVGTVLWLAGDASKFVTGITVPVDGGFSSYSGV